jgi:hypothetical protein
MKKNKTEDFLKIENDLKSWDLVQRNGWAIKISILDSKYFMMLFASQYTGQSMLRVCSEEKEAIEVINYITQKNAREILDLGY